jgi:hypothetical protein
MMGDDEAALPANFQLILISFDWSRPASEALFRDWVVLGKG